MINISSFINTSLKDVFDVYALVVQRNHLHSTIYISSFINIYHHQGILQSCMSFVRKNELHSIINLSSFINPSDEKSIRWLCVNAIEMDELRSSSASHHSIKPPKTIAFDFYVSVWSKKMKWLLSSGCQRWSTLCNTTVFNDCIWCSTRSMSWIFFRIFHHSFLCFIIVMFDLHPSILMRPMVRTLSSTSHRPSTVPITISSDDYVWLWLKRTSNIWCCSFHHSQLLRTRILFCDCI